MTRGILVGLFLLSSGVARADTLADLRTKLTTLDGNDSVRGTITLQVSNQTGEGKKASRHEGKAQVNFTAGEEGLSLTWDLAHLDAAAGKKAPAKDATQTEDGEEPPSRQAMRDLNPAAIHGLVSTSRGMLHKLENAELLDETTEMVDGRALRRVRLKLNPTLSEKQRKYLKELNATASLWLDAEGWPVRAESNAKIRFRAFLVVGFESEEQEEFRFARVGQRLLTTHHKKHSVGTGAGEEFDRTAETTVTVQDRTTMAERPATATEPDVLTR